MEGLVNYSSEDEQDEPAYNKKVDGAVNREYDGHARNYRRSTGGGGGSGHKDEAYERHSSSSHQRDGGRRNERYSDGANYSRDNRDTRDQRARDSRDYNNGHKRSYDGRDGRDNRDNRDIRDNRDNRDGRSTHDRNFQRNYSRDEYNRRERPRNDERYNNRHGQSSSSSSSHNNSRPRYSGGNGNINYDARYSHNQTSVSRRNDERGGERSSSTSTSRNDRNDRQQQGSNKYSSSRQRRSRTRSRSQERKSPANSKPAHTSDNSSEREYREEKLEQTEPSDREIAPLMSLPLSDTAPKQPNVVTVANSPTGTVVIEAASVVQLPSYYNPSVINPTKYAEQVQKRKLLWGAKKTEDKVAAKWENAHFSQDTDGKVASKFMRLMGIKNATAATAPADSGEGSEKVAPDVKSREAMFSSMEQQYEVARQVTHTMRGVGLGFGSSRPY